MWQGCSFFFLLSLRDGANVGRSICPFLLTYLRSNIIQTLREYNLSLSLDHESDQKIERTLTQTDYLTPALTRNTAPDCFGLCSPRQQVRSSSPPSTCPYRVRSGHSITSRAALSAHRCHLTAVAAAVVGLAPVDTWSFCPDARRQSL